MDKLYPTCMPCPDHATCSSPNSDPICPPEYLLKPHPFSFNNILPVPQICVLDKSREYQSLQVADATDMILRERAGKVECALYNQQPSTAEILARKRVSIDELKTTIESMKDVSVWTVAGRRSRVYNRPTQRANGSSFTTVISQA
jgi:hypothetical protein